MQLIERLPNRSDIAPLIGAEAIMASDIGIIINPDCTPLNP
jgi:hypothetical protein